MNCKRKLDGKPSHSNRGRPIADFHLYIDTDIWINNHEKQTMTITAVRLYIFAAATTVAYQSLVVMITINEITASEEPFNYIVKTNEA